MNGLNGAPLDKIIAFVRKWALMLFVALVIIFVLVIYLIIQILAKYSLLILLGLAIYAYIKRDFLKGYYYKLKLAVVEYQRKNSDR